MALYIGIKNLIGKGAAWLRSKWTTIVTQLLAEFRYRVAGGSDNALLPESKGRAVFKKVYGKTVKFNQLVQNGDFSDGTTGWQTLSSGTTSAANGVCTLSSSVRYGATYKEVPNLIESHKVFISTDVVNITSDATFVFSLMSSNNQWVGNARAITTTGRNKHIESCPANATRITMGSNMVSGTTYDVSFTNVQIHDITAIFGTDAEIAAALGIAVADITTATGVAAFENWLALNGGAQDYYPYDEGSLVSFKGQGVKSVGFNKWDGTYTPNKLMNRDGTIQNRPGTENKFAMTGYIPVLPNKDYYLNIYGVGSSLNGCSWFDADKNYVGGAAFISTDKVGVLHSPANARYLVTSIFIDYISETCVNLSDASKNGTYVPYWEDVVDLSSIYSLEDGQGNVLFPDGLLSAGSVTDEVTETELTKKIGIRAYQSGDESDPTVITDGTTTYYPLVTPIVIPHDTPMQYAVDKYSTEELLVPASVDGSPTSTNIVADIEYQAK